MSGSDPSTWALESTVSQTERRRRDSIFAIRLLALALAVFETVGSFLQPGLPATPGGFPAEAVQVLLALAGMVAIIFGRWRAAIVASVLLATTAALRDRLTGQEIELLFVALVAVVAVARLRLMLAFLAVCGLGVLAYEWLGTDPMYQRAAPIAYLAGTAIGLIARAVLARQRTSARRLAAEAAMTRATRARVRRELAADLEAVVSALLADSRRTLRRIGPGSRAADLARALETVSDDARAAMSRLRGLLAVIDGAAEATDLRTHQRFGRSAWSPPEWFRWFLLGSAVAVTIAFVVANYGRPAYAVAGALCLLGLGLLPWQGRFAVACAVSVVAISVVGADIPQWRVPEWSVPLAIGLLTVVAASSRKLVLMLLAASATAAFVVTRPYPLMERVPTKDGSRVIIDLTVYEVVFAVIAGLVLGLWLGRHRRLMEAERAQAAELARERAEAAAEERSALARELHDLVGHELSLVSLRTLMVEGESDPTVLRGAVADIAATVEALQESLDTLVDHLRATMGRLEAAGPLVAPSEAVESASETLRDHGQVVHARVDPGVDAINPTLQRTLDRILRESTTNMMRHAPAGGVCEVALTRESDVVVLTASNPLGEGRLDFSTGKGLRGIEERVRWHRGFVASGPRGDGSWGLRVELPLDAGLPDPGVTVSVVGSRTRGVSADASGMRA